MNLNTDSRRNNGNTTVPIPGGLNRDLQSGGTENSNSIPTHKRSNYHRGRQGGARDLKLKYHLSTAKKSSQQNDFVSDTMTHEGAERVSHSLGFGVEQIQNEHDNSDRKVLLSEAQLSSDLPLGLKDKPNQNQGRDKSLPTS